MFDAFFNEDFLKNYYKWIEDTLEIKTIILFLMCIFFIVIFLILPLIKSYSIYNKKNIKGGESTCDINYITSITPAEDNVVIYYAGKIYNIKQTELTTDVQRTYFEHLQILAKDSYEYEDSTGINYKIKQYKDLTKFFNYYELNTDDEKDKRPGWQKALYKNKTEIIDMLKNNIDAKDIICINDIK